MQILSPLNLSFSADCHYNAQNLVSKSRRFCPTETNLHNDKHHGNMFCVTGGPLVNGG